MNNEPMDPCTLAAVSAAAHAAGEQGQQQQRPAKRQKDELFPYVPDEPYPGGVNDLENSDEEEDEQPAKKGKRKASTAATSKANREKARREKINDRRAALPRMSLVACSIQLCNLSVTHAPACLRFVELAKLVDPGKEPKTDKLSILLEAIRFVHQTLLENTQLKQINKFLEVRRLCRIAALDGLRLCTNAFAGHHMAGALCLSDGLYMQHILHLVAASRKQIIPP